MTEDWAKLQQRYPWLKPWVPIAALLAIVIVGYYGWLGVRYFDASTLTSSIEGQLPSIPLVNQESDEIMKADVESQQRRLANIRDTFGNRRGSELIAVVARLAQENGLAVDSIAAGKPEPESLGEFRITTLSMSVLVRGETANIYDFVRALNLKVPLVITKFQMGDLDSPGKVPSAQLGLRFFQSPELPSEEQEDN